jgi:hypothetical protein
LLIYLFIIKKKDKAAVGRVIIKIFTLEALSYLYNYIKSRLLKFFELAIVAFAILFFFIFFFIPIFFVFADGGIKKRLKKKAQPSAPLFLLFAGG